MQQRSAQDGARDSYSKTRHAPHVITVASGKGGVGKSCLVANLGTLLARSGLRVLLIDGDFGLANLDIIFGVHAQASLEQVLEGTVSMKSAVLGIEPNLWLLPSSSGLMGFRQKDTLTRNRMIEMLEKCPWEMDVILVDIGAGIHANVLNLHSAIYHSVVVLTPEPTSMTDAYGLIKLLRQEIGVSRVSVLVNQVADGKEGVQTFQKLKDVAARFLDVELEYLGHCERDEKVTQSVIKRKILVDLAPDARSTACLELLSKRLKSHRLGWMGEDTLEEGRSLSHLKVSSEMTSRFQDEPARLAPGNGARFWRTLLGEVKV